MAVILTVVLAGLLAVFLAGLLAGPLAVQIVVPQPDVLARETPMKVLV